MLVFPTDQFKMVLKVRYLFKAVHQLKYNITKFNTELYVSTGSWQSSSTSLELFRPLNGLSGNNLIYFKQF